MKQGRTEGVGVATNTGQPAFRATLSTDYLNRTPGSTLNPIPFDTVDFDNTGDYNTGSAQFSIPTTGIYQLNFTLNLHDVDTNHLYIHGYIAATGTPGTGRIFHQFDPNFTAALAEQYTMHVSGLLYLQDTEGVVCRFLVNAGSSTVDILQSYSNFSGMLIG